MDHDLWLLSGISTMNCVAYGCTSPLPIFPRVVRAQGSMPTLVGPRFLIIRSFWMMARNTSWLTSCTHRKAHKEGRGSKGCMCFTVPRHVGLLFSDLFFDAASWLVNHVVSQSIGTRNYICQAIGTCQLCKTLRALPLCDTVSCIISSFGARW